jgi:hypothetical protein
MNKYKVSNDIDKVLDYKKIQLSSKIKNNRNSLNCDLEFIKQAYKIKCPLLFIYKNDFSGIFMHSKQLYNLFNNEIELYSLNKIINVNYKNTNYILYDFIKRINNFTLEEITNITIKELYNNLTCCKLLLLVFIGNKIGELLIEQIKEYYILENCAIIFCIKHTNNEDYIINYDNLKNTFLNSAVYLCNEFGNDIVPTLLVYNKIKDYNYEYIIKLHTKSNTACNKLTNYLLTNKLTELLIVSFNNNFTKSSTISLIYKKYKDDKYNLNLYKKYNNLIKKQYFSVGTIFLTEKKTFDKVLDFFIENYKKIVFNNMYDDNSINRNSSYIHFIERLFGLI